MARVAVADLLQRERQAQAERVAKMVERKGKPRRTPGPKLAEAMREMVKSGDWSRATNRHLVALYVYMHERVYGVASELAAAYSSRVEAEKNPLFGAEAAAKRMLEQEFRGDPGAMATYIRWAWLRERAREEKANGAERGRIGWQLMFSSRSLLQDYRLSARRAANG